MEKYCSQILLLCLVALGCPAIRAASKDGCFAYDTETVRLSGRAQLKAVPGPPEYESIAKGDRREYAWLLHLAKPICTEASGDDEAEANVKTLHLVLRGKQFKQLRSQMKKGRVSLTGTLFHSHTAHHRTSVLLDVKRIESR
jgi:hypothetical protein